MSMNDWTGLESFTSYELIRDASRSHLEVELAKRLEDLLDQAEADRETLQALREHDVTAEEIRSIADVIIDCGATTVALLNTLRDFDIEDADMLRAVLENAQRAAA
jgi:dephospho-CoA kinase